MVLPSQTARNDGRRSQMFRRRRFARLPILLVALIVAAGGVWLLTQNLGGPPRAKAGQAENRGNVKEVVAAPPSKPAAKEQEQQRTAPPDRTAEAPAPRPAAPNRESRVPTGPAGLAAPTTNPTTTAGTTSGNSNAAEMRPRSTIERGLDLITRQPIEARKSLTRTLETASLTDDEQERIRAALSQLGETLTFGPDVHPDDPFARKYTIKSGDMLEKIVRRHGYLVHWKFIQRINGIMDPSKVRDGQSIKVLTGPFHAIVDKSNFRLDLYLGDGEDRIFVRSFDVGLGALDSTPVGRFRIGAKAENPDWTNPRTLEHFERNDPLNPIGEHWLELVGIDEQTREFTGYGLHGTIEPDSIGMEQSMGCIRMLPNDVAIVYEVLLPDVSIVEIRP